MKKLALSLLMLIAMSYLVISCGYVEPKQISEIEVKYNVPFIVDSIEFTLVDYGRYASFSSDKIAPDTTLLKIIGYAPFLRDKISYFYFKNFRDRGEDYASICDSIITFRSKNPVVNKITRHINSANNWLYSINGQMETVSFLKGNEKLITNLKEIVSEDLKKLKEDVRLAKQEINELNKNIFANEAEQIKQIELTAKKIERKYKKL